MLPISETTKKPITSDSDWESRIPALASRAFLSFRATYTTLYRFASVSVHPSLLTVWLCSERSGDAWLVRREHVSTVFFERLVSPRLAETVARDAGARAAVLDPIEGLPPSEQSHGDTYLTLMRRNLEQLRKALGCH